MHPAAPEAGQLGQTDKVPLNAHPQAICKRRQCKRGHKNGHDGCNQDALSFGDVDGNEQGGEESEPRRGATAQGDGPVRDQGEQEGRK